MTPEAQTIKEKYQLDIMKYFLTCASKDNINRIKKQPRDWVKIFANSISDKKLIFRNCAKFLKHNKNLY